MNYHAITYPDLNNGVGLRVTLWLSGCNNKCKGCQNPQTWNENSGKKFNKLAKESLFLALSKDYISGITFSGGDPLHDNNIYELNNLIDEIKEYFPNKNIWIYSGSVIENIFNENSLRKNIVEKCDVFVDGKFVEELKDLSLPWRGSSNQRVIDIKQTLSQDRLVLYCD
jgi:anaerobic ribonucleoside-triphosphate reductase activating protein